MQMVFLGGTAGNPADPAYNRWREDRVIPVLCAVGIPADCLFNPVVTDWNSEAQRREDEIKSDPNTFMLYVITNPRTSGSEVSAYSLVELVIALYDEPKRTVVAFDTSELSPNTAKALTKAISDLRKRFPSAPIFDSIEDATSWLAGRLLIPKVG
jgi:hypothetical protein